MKQKILLLKGQSIRIFQDAEMVSSLTNLNDESFELLFEIKTITCTDTRYIMINININYRSFTLFGNKLEIKDINGEIITTITTEDY